MATVLGYTILAGDTLSAIASGLNASAGVTVKEIEDANPGIDPAALAIGKIVNVPARGSGAIVLRYTVMPGDSYTKIVTELDACAGLTYQEIEKANPSVNPAALKVGQVINIPEAGTVPVPPAPIPADVQTSGFWWWTWSHAAAAPTGTSLGIAFSGWADPGTAVQQSAGLMKRLPGLKFISLGGGNSKGAFTSTCLGAITTAINAGIFGGYDGIAYDVEEGDSGLALAFQKSFAAAKARNFKVLVTVSHSAPYGIGDAPGLMQSFFSDPNIDYLSPQLYTDGDETINNYAISGGVSWAQYAAAKAAVVPSIVNAGLYPGARSYFQGQGVDITGFVQWGQGAS